MDFHLPQELFVTSDYVIDEIEHEDDVFYRELREQVLQLTAEDDDGDDVIDDEEVCRNKSSNMVAAAKQGLGTNKRCVQQIRGYYNWPDNKDGDKSAPTWILNLWRTGNGTGVFIPQIVPSSGKRQRKRKPRRGRTSKKVEENKDSN